MALDAIAIDFFNQLAPGAVDFALGQSVPFLEGLRDRSPAASADRGNLYTPGADRTDKPSARRRRGG